MGYSKIAPVFFLLKQKIKNPVIGCHKLLRGGRRMLWGYIRLEYFINSKKIIKDINYIELDKIDNFHIGDCVEVLVSLDDENVYKWNDEKVTI